MSGVKVANDAAAADGAPQRPPASPSRGNKKAVGTPPGLDMKRLMLPSLPSGSVRPPQVSPRNMERFRIKHSRFLEKREPDEWDFRSLHEPHVQKHVGDVLVAEGAVLDELYVVQSGAFQATRDTLGQKAQVIVLTAGCVVGDVPMLASSPSTTHVECVEEGEVTVLSRADVLSMLRTVHPQLEQLVVQVSKQLYHRFTAYLPYLRTIKGDVTPRNEPSEDRRNSVPVAALDALHAHLLAHWKESPGGAGAGNGATGVGAGGSGAPAKAAPPPSITSTSHAATATTTAITTTTTTPGDQGTTAPSAQGKSEEAAAEAAPAMTKKKLDLLFLDMFEDAVHHVVGAARNHKDSPFVDELLRLWAERWLLTSLTSASETAIEQMSSASTQWGKLRTTLKALSGFFRHTRTASLRALATPVSDDDIVESDDDDDDDDDDDEGDNSAFGRRISTTSITSSSVSSAASEDELAAADVELPAALAGADKDLQPLVSLYQKSKTRYDEEDVPSSSGSNSPSPGPLAGVPAAALASAPAGLASLPSPAASSPTGPASAAAAAASHRRAHSGELSRASSMASWAPAPSSPSVSPVRGTTNDMASVARRSNSSDVRVPAVQRVGSGLREVRSSQDMSLAHVALAAFRSRKRSEMTFASHEEDDEIERIPGTVTMDLHRWNFDSRSIDDARVINNFMVQLVVDLGFCDALHLRPERLHTFVSRVAKDYHQSNPYHNLNHALEVAHSCAYFITEAHAVGQQMTSIDALALVLASIGHDCGHPGHNNEFEAHMCTKRFEKYGKVGTLERFHVELTVNALHESALLADMGEKQRNELLATMEAAIMATDMSQHFHILAQAESAPEVLHKPLALKTLQERRFLCKVFIKAADISNPAKHPLMAMKAATAIMTELFAQGDKEREMGLAVPAIRDRLNLNVLKSQIDFITFVVKPMFLVLVRSFPTLLYTFQLLCFNHKLYRNEYKSREDEAQHSAGEVVNLNDRRSSTASGISVASSTE